MGCINSSSVFTCSNMRNRYECFKERRCITKLFLIKLSPKLSIKETSQTTKTFRSSDQPCTIILLNCKCSHKLLQHSELLKISKQISLSVDQCSQHHPDSPHHCSDDAAGNDDNASNYNATSYDNADESRMFRMATTADGYFSAPNTICSPPPPPPSSPILLSTIPLQQHKSQKHSHLAAQQPAARRKKKQSRKKRGRQMSQARSSVPTRTNTSGIVSSPAMAYSLCSLSSSATRRHPIRKRRDCDRFVSPPPPPPASHVALPDATLSGLNSTSQANIWWKAKLELASSTTKPPENLGSNQQTRVLCSRSTSSTTSGSCGAFCSSACCASSCSCSSCSECSVCSVRGGENSVHNLYANCLDDDEEAEPDLIQPANSVDSAFSISNQSEQELNKELNEDLH